MSKVIYFAGGCFWGTQKFFDQFDGVLRTEVGYANGRTAEPRYEELKKTGHAETVLVEYDEDRITLEELLNFFFQAIDPTPLHRQGPDGGTPYRTGIYYTDPAQLPAIERKLREVKAKYDVPVVTEVLPLDNYYTAEDYHQKYLDRTPNGYCHIGGYLFHLQEKRAKRVHAIESDKKLGFGMMRLPITDPKHQSSIDIEQVKQMVDLFMANGFTYFDTALMYHGFKSEQAVKAALVDRYPRESFTIATKMHELYFAKGESLDDLLAACLGRLGVTYIDYYLIHDIGHDNYQTFADKGVFEWVVQKKAEGVFRHIGFSCHDSADFLEWMLPKHPELEFVQIQLNYLDWDSAGINAHASYDTITKYGRDVVVMEPVKGGTLVNIPDEAVELMKSYAPERSVASWAIRFAASLENVKVVLSGMSNLEQMEDNISYMKDFEPLNGGELEIISSVTDMINESIAIPCTACNYCTAGCPMNIAIPRYFSLYNTDLKEIGGKWTPQQEYYDRLIRTFGPAGDCIGCGQCEAICPQHLPIIEHLKAVAEHFGK